MNKSRLEWYIVGCLFIAVMIFFSLANEQSKKIQTLYTTDNTQKDSVSSLKQNAASATFQ